MGSSQTRTSAAVLLAMLAMALTIALITFASATAAFGGAAVAALGWCLWLEHHPNTATSPD